MIHPYFGQLMPTQTLSGTYTVVVSPTVAVTNPDWQKFVDSFAEYGYWERTSLDLAEGRADLLWAGGRAGARFVDTFGGGMAESRAQRIAMCGLMMAMCEYDGNAAFRGEP